MTSCTATRVATLQLSMRHGERSFQPFSTSMAQSADLSVWHNVHGFGTSNVFVAAGVMKRKVWACTFTSFSVSSISGMWQATHWFPALSDL